MLKFIKKCFFTTMTFFKFNPLSTNSLECVSMNNQKCKTISEMLTLMSLCFIPIVLQ